MVEFLWNDFKVYSSSVSLALIEFRTFNTDIIIGPLGLLILNRLLHTLSSWLSNWSRNSLLRFLRRLQLFLHHFFKLLLVIQKFQTSFNSLSYVFSELINPILGLYLLHTYILLMRPKHSAFEKVIWNVKSYRRLFDARLVIVLVFAFPDSVEVVEGESEVADILVAVAWLEISQSIVVTALLQVAAVECVTQKRTT